MFTNKECPDYTAWMSMIIWTFSVRTWRKGLFSPDVEHHMQNLRGLATHGIFCAIPAKGDNCLLTCTSTPIRKDISSKRKEFAPDWSKFFHFRVDHFSAKRQPMLTVSFLENISFLLKYLWTEVKTCSHHQSAGKGIIIAKVKAHLLLQTFNRLKVKSKQFKGLGNELP